MALEQEGAAIVAVDIHNDVENTAPETNKGGRKALELVADITSPEQVDSIVEKTIDTFGRMGILVNNVGVVGKGFSYGNPMILSGCLPGLGLG